MTATRCKRTASLNLAQIDAASEDESQIPALLLAMASIAEASDSTGFGEELREAAEAIEDSDSPREDADFWLSQFYQWADTMRVWIG